jgi:hypothetical protein
MVKDLGIDKDLAETINDMQWGGCDKPLVPCYVCNIKGTKPVWEDGYSYIPGFWVQK